MDNGDLISVTAWATKLRNLILCLDFDGFQILELFDWRKFNLILNPPYIKLRNLNSNSGRLNTFKMIDTLNPFLK